MAEPFVVKPLSPMRQVIATRMTEAMREIPHFRLSVDIEVDALLRLRDSFPDDKGSRPSLTDLLIKACAGALMQAPEVNILWAGKEVQQYCSADIAVVTAVEGGVSTPIIRDSEKKSVFEISAELKDLRKRAQRNALKMREILGGSFTISNLGMYGIDQFDAIINPPQCAILAVGAARSKVRLSPSGQIGTATVLRATLSSDHRAIDGVTGARFLTAFRQRIEESESLVETSYGRR
jgi:pyruvate dehydrogenase E2 component (dihydrolipoamide acetyltransferase)